jgi:hypothetical protein
MPTPEGLRSLLGIAALDPLDLRVLAASAGDGYQRRLIEYGTVGRERVQAFLLVPDGARRAPGVQVRGRRAGR